jgi:formylglycine-generating enzyme required for sulfatase activity
MIRRTPAASAVSELERAREITSELDPTTEDYSPEGAESAVEDLAPRVARLRTDAAMSNVFGVAAVHPNPHVRYHMLGLAAENVSNVYARRYITSLTHDDQDFVAFEAIRLCGTLELQESIDDLVSIIGWPSGRIDHGGQPVGLGRATALRAELRIFDTEDREELERLEERYQEDGHFPVERHRNPSLQPDVPEDRRPTPDETPDGMVYVPGGTYEMGVPESDQPYGRFVATYTDPYEVELPSFYIDEYPVTNAEYDAFVESVAEHGHEFCHPSEPDGKDHRRSTRHEDVGDDHPVTGIDYYDMYAYAQWAGKDLPLEEEWEVAARGESGSLYPWGDEFDPDRLNWAGNAFDTEIEGVEQWSDLLADAVEEGIVEARTTPVDAFPEGRSEFGVADVVGNVWEYTKSNHLTRQELYPILSHPSPTSHENLIGNNEAFPVIRGGAWSSIPEMTSAVFRGKDLLTDRHNEIGFRCVKRARDGDRKAE